MAKKKSKFDNKFKSTTPADCRTANVRIERKVKDDLPKLSLNFKDFDFNQCPPGQTFEQWQKEGMLSVLMQKFVDVCSNNIIEAKEKKTSESIWRFPDKQQVLDTYIYYWGCSVGNDTTNRWTKAKIGGLYHRICLLSCIFG